MACTARNLTLAGFARQGIIDNEDVMHGPISCPLQNNLPKHWELLMRKQVLPFTPPPHPHQCPPSQQPSQTLGPPQLCQWFNMSFVNSGTGDKIELNEEALLIILWLHKVFQPFLLRRLKRDVESELPDKVEKVIKVHMSALQSQLYRQIKTHNEKDLKGYVSRILSKFFATGHRVLIFFQMTKVIDIMEDFLKMMGWKGMKMEEHALHIQQFNVKNSVSILSTRAGGLGLNLQTADTVHLEKSVKEVMYACACYKLNTIDNEMAMFHLDLCPQTTPLPFSKGPMSCLAPP
ncbi:P-loop containing nucleoside triphosphate hydrolase protein [Suillus spraguei]|nr:P-loop containing nucleoside triphosphate hydrolase protein [Suillus spraguei]